MLFSTFSAVLAFALSVNAVSLNRRAVSPNVQTCINDLSAADDQFGFVVQDINIYVIGDGYAGMLDIQAKEAVLETKLSTAGTSCCKTTTTVTSEDAEAVLAEVAILTPKIVNALNIVIAKKPVFDAVPLATLLVKGDLNSLYTKVIKITTCLIAVTPAEYINEALEYTDTIDAAFVAAINAYA